MIDPCGVLPGPFPTLLINVANDVILAFTISDFISKSGENDI